MSAKRGPTKPAPGWAVLVGINRYTDGFSFPELRCCVNDAVGIYALLSHAEHGNFDPDHVRLLLDGTDAEVRSAAESVLRRLRSAYGLAFRSGLADEIVARRIFPQPEEIIAELGRAAQNAGPGDLLLIQLSGHGKIFQGKHYLVSPRTRDPHYLFTALPWDFVQDTLGRSAAGSKLLLLDACYATSATAVTPEPASLAEIVQPSFPASSGVKLLTSCRPWELCYERDAASGDPLHGLFTYYLLEGWAGNADETAKGYVTLADLHRYVDDKVKTWVATHAGPGPLQTPTLSGEGAERIVLGGDRSKAAAASAAPGAHASAAAPAPLPLELRVWAMPAAADVRGLRPTPRGGSPEFRVGERVRIRCRANRDSYLYLLDVDAAGQVVQLLPSAVWPDNRLRANQDHLLPGEHDKYDLPVQGPEGVETLIALATAEPAPVLGSAFPLRPRQLSEPELAELQSALSRLSRDQWAVGQEQFLVREPQ